MFQSTARWVHQASAREVVGEVEETEVVEGEVSLLEEGEGVVQGVEEVEAHQGAEVQWMVISLGSSRSS